MKFKGFLLKMIPIIIMVIVTMLISVNVYFKILKMEEEICWNRLEIATNSTAEKIKIRLNDNINFLQTVSDAYILTHDIENVAAVGEYVNSVVQMTIFDRIDVILPDNSIITQNGENLERGGKSGYNELVEKGAHITQRLESSFTGEDVICCVVPIDDEEIIKGLLVGTISCATLSDIFEVFTYGEKAQLFLIDCEDGNYLMDNWHDELGNIYDLGLRKNPDDNEMIDMVPTIINRERARYAFVSNTNEEVTYQYCAPVDGYNWQLCVAVQEEVVFANAKELESILLIVGFVEILLIFVYVGWNTFINIMASKNEKRLKHLEYEKVKNETRAKFISNMSHDIKTPLNGIVGMIEIIKNHRYENDVVDDCLKKIEISAKYLSTLTNDMLDINEIENNKLILQDDFINLKEFADDITSIMEREANEVGVSYYMDYSKLYNPYIVGSSIHIKRILVNLIGNAIKYSKNSGKNVWVTIFDEDIKFNKNHRMYRFIIKDNGIGMSEEFQKSMYIAFEQEMIGARSEYQGYGLGLTIVNYLVKKMNGKIELVSAKGKGSTFTISIPFKIDSRNESCQNKSEMVSLSGYRILLVEDNEFNMQIAKVLLTDAGALVDTAVNGKIATEIFGASDIDTYDLILMDIMMPVMDGCEAAIVIRQMQRTDAKSIPIIAMTASIFSEDVERCKNAGMNGHIPKPFEINQLIKAIIKYCNN